jgi:hypothetical protein
MFPSSCDVLYSKPAPHPKYITSLRVMSPFDFGLVGLLTWTVMEMETTFDPSGGVLDDCLL